MTWSRRSGTSRGKSPARRVEAALEPTGSHSSRSPSTCWKWCQCPWSPVKAPSTVGWTYRGDTIRMWVFLSLSGLRLEKPNLPLCSFQTSPIQDIIKIGETLTILVYLRYTGAEYGLKVRECWAYDSEDYDSPQTTKLQLTDAEGCPR